MIPYSGINLRSTTKAVQPDAITRIRETRVGNGGVVLTLWLCEVIEPVGRGVFVPVDRHSSALVPGIRKGF